MACNARLSRWNHLLTKSFRIKDVDADFEELPPSERSIALARPDLLPDLTPQTAHTPVQELSLNWLLSDSNLTAGEVTHTEIRSPASSPRPTQTLSSLPPSSPPEPPSSLQVGNTRSSDVENTDEASLGMEQAEMADSASSLQGACTTDEACASDDGPTLFPERTTHPELLHVELPVFELDSQSLLGKRKADDRNIDGRSPPPLKHKDHCLMTQDLASKSTLPNPKRPTIAAQKLQHKKLTTPFRSPALKRPKSELVSMKGPPLTAQPLTPEKEERMKQNMHPIELPAFHTIDTKKKHRTQRAAAQFKSPLSMDASSKLVSSVRMTPIIQALERKLQLLKRAVKVKQDGEEEALHALVNKWTEAGREIACEVWELVKDNASSEDQGWGKPQSKGKPMTSAFEDSWGWDGKSNEKSNTSDERNWGWDIEPRGTIDDNMDEMKTAENPEGAEICRYEDDDTDEKKQDTLGTMLMQLGIAPETLGWNAEEGVFQGE
ncbi:hypothetical protein FPV67DRAFT_1664438 [Lyophyllum atratum]|nr:hypothetical protein FPV67DRAFT_1664438 [Lyophyllum atratum]